MVLWPANLLNLFTSSNDNQLRALGSPACSGVTLTRGWKRGWQGKMLGGLWVSCHQLRKCCWALLPTPPPDKEQHLADLHPGPQDTHVHTPLLCPQRRPRLWAHPWLGSISACPLSPSRLPPSVTGPTASCVLTSLLLAPSSSSGLHSNGVTPPAL